MVLSSLDAATANNRGIAVVTLSYVLFGVSVLFRLIGGHFWRRRYGWEDLFLLLGLAIALAQSILVERSEANGLGRHQDAVSSGELSRYFRYAYTSQILAVVSMFLTKLSVVRFFARLSPRTVLVQGVCAVTYVATTVWGALSLFGLIYQCASPRLTIYTPTRCTSGAIWYPIIVISIIIDLGLSFIILPIIHRLSLSPSQRLISSILFAFRTLVVITSIAWLSLLAPSLKSADQTYSRAVPVCLQQIVMNLSLITATIPMLYRPLRSLIDTSGLTSDRSQSQVRLNQHPSVSTQPSNETSEVKNSGAHVQGRQVIIDFRPDLLERTRNVITHDPSISMPQTYYNIVTNSGHHPSLSRPKPAFCMEDRSHSADCATTCVDIDTVDDKDIGTDSSGLTGPGSRSKSDDMIIHTTRTWDITYDDRVRVPPRLGSISYGRS